MYCRDTKHRVRVAVATLRKRNKASGINGARTRASIARNEASSTVAAASRPSEAIREYQEAYRVFPNPATAEKIRQLQDNSLGL